MITLYQFSTSPFTDKVRRVLAYKGLDYCVHEVVRSAVPAGDYAKASPTGKFPTIDHDGHIVWDSTDIVEYLDRSFPNRPLIPSDPKAAAMVHIVEDWADESLYFYEMTMRLAWAHNLEAALDEFAVIMPGIPREQRGPVILENVGVLTRAQGIGRKPRDQVVTDLARHFRSLDALLSANDWLACDSLSIADLAVVAQVNALLYAVEAREALEATKHLKGWMARIDLLAPKSAGGLQ